VGVADVDSVGGKPCKPMQRDGVTNRTMRRPSAQPQIIDAPAAPDQAFVAL